MVARLAHYELKDRLGKGGMGVVYLSRDTRLDRWVALKLLAPSNSLDASRRSRFLREARAAAKLNHPGIATIYDVGEATLEDPGLLGALGASSPEPAEVLYIAMEYVEGRDLDPSDRERGVDEVVDLGLQIARGLEAAHQHGVIHRDLKPQNIRVTPDGRAKILDFGLAKMLQGAEEPSESLAEETFATGKGMILGTVPYISPEQVQGGQVDARSDLFSFGVVLYQLLTGELPFQGEGLMGYVKALVHDTPKPVSRSVPGVSSDLAAVIARLLDKDPTRRFQSAAEVCGALEALVRGESTAIEGAFQSGSWRRWQIWRRRSPWLWGSLAAALLAVVAATVWALGLGRGGEPVRQLAVLPFINQTGDGALDPLSAELGSSLVTVLERWSGVTVASARAVAPLVDSPGGALARRLKVGTLFEGWVRPGDGGVEVVITCRDTATDMTLWDAVIPGDPQSPVLRDLVVDAVVRRLPLSLSDEERQRLRRDGKSSADAYRSYFEGEALLERAAREEDLKEAERFFQLALEQDPKLPWAYAGLSLAYWRYYRSSKDAAHLATSKQWADRAREIAPDLSELDLAEARTLRAEGEAESSVARLLELLDRQPNLAQAHAEAAIGYEKLGDLDAAERSYLRATELRPGYWRYWDNLGAFYLEQRRFAEAGPILERAVELAPEGVDRPRENLGTLSLLRQDLEAALEAYQGIPEARRSASVWSNMAYAHAERGRLEMAERFYAEAAKLRPRFAQVWTDLGDMQLRLGKGEEARASYGKALALGQEELAGEPYNPELQVARVFYLAKAGDCPQALAGAGEISEPRNLKAPEVRRLTVSYSLCGDKKHALEGTRLLLEQGEAPARIRSLPELAWLVGDDRFEALLRSASGG